MAVAHVRYENAEIVTRGKQQVFVTLVISPSDFFVTLEKWRDHHFAVDSTKAIGQTILQHPQVGDMCLVQFFIGSRGFWNRAEIVEISKDGNATVWFVDYGNVVTVRQADVFELEDEGLMKYPRLAIKCRLNGVQPNPDSEWSQLVQQYCEKLTKVKNYCLTATFLSEENNVYLVNLHRQGGSSIAYEMIVLQYAKALKVSTIEQENYTIRYALLMYLRLTAHQFRIWMTLRMSNGGISLEINTEEN